MAAGIATLDWSWSEMPSVLLGIPWPALRGGTTSEERDVPSRTGGERILEMLWKPQMPLTIGLGGSQPYSRREFQETLWERFRGLSGFFPEFLPKSASCTGGTAHLKSTVREKLRGSRRGTSREVRGSQRSFQKFDLFLIDLNVFRLSFPLKCLLLLNCDFKSKPW